MDESSSLLRICNEDVVAYLKVLEMCAATTLIAASNIRKQKKGDNNNKENANAGDDEQNDDDDDGSVAAAAATMLQGKKQLLFRSLELLKRDDGETVFRILSHEERLRRFQSANSSADSNSSSGNNGSEERLVLKDVYGQLLTIARRKILLCLPDLGGSSTSSSSSSSYSSSSADAAVLWPPASVIEEALSVPGATSERFQDTRSSVESIIRRPKEFREGTLLRILPALSASAPSPRASGNNAVAKGGVQSDSSDAKNQEDEPPFDERLLAVLSLSDALVINALECEAPGLYECATIGDASEQQQQHVIARRRKRQGDHASGEDELSVSIQSVCEHDLSANPLLTKRVSKWAKFKKATPDTARAKLEQEQREEADRKMIPAMEYQTVLMASNVISISLRADVGLLEPLRLAAESVQVTRALKNVVAALSSSSSSSSSAAVSSAATSSGSAGVLAAAASSPPLLSVASALEMCVGTSPRQLMLRLDEAAAASSSPSFGRRFLVRYGAHITVAAFNSHCPFSSFLVLVPRNGERDVARIQFMANAAIRRGESLATSLLSPAQMKKLRAASSKLPQPQRASLDLDAAAENLALRVFFTTPSLTVDASKPAAAAAAASAGASLICGGAGAVSSSFYSSALLGEADAHSVPAHSNRRFFVSPFANSGIASGAAGAGVVSKSSSGVASNNSATTASSNSGGSSSSGSGLGAVLQDPNFLTVEFSEAELMPHALLYEDEDDFAAAAAAASATSNLDDDSVVMKTQQHDKCWPVARVVRVAFSANVLQRSPIAVLHGHRVAGHLTPTQLQTTRVARQATSDRQKRMILNAKDDAMIGGGGGGGGGGAIAAQLGEAAAREEEKFVADQKYLEDYFQHEARRAAEQKERVAAAAAQKLTGKNSTSTGAAASGNGGATAAAAAAAGGGVIDEQALSLSIIRFLTRQPGAKLDAISRAVGTGVQQNQLVRVIKRVADFDRATTGWKLKPAQ